MRLVREERWRGHRRFAGVLAVSATLVAGPASLAGAQQPAVQGQPAQQPQYLTPEQQAEIQKMPAIDESRRVQTADIEALLAKGDVVFLDVREPKEIEDLGTLEGYINIPVTELEKRLNELPKDKAVLTA
jgi:hypothetical protein